MSFQYCQVEICVFVDMCFFDRTQQSHPYYCEKTRFSPFYLSFYLFFSSFMMKHSAHFPVFTYVFLLFCSKSVLFFVDNLQTYLPAKQFLCILYL